MGSYLSVARGSIEPPRMMVVEYKVLQDQTNLLYCRERYYIRYWGISLKPSRAMDEMKWDMGGAASVFGVVKFLQDLNQK